MTGDEPTPMVPGTSLAITTNGQNYQAYMSGSPSGRRHRTVGGVENPKAHSPSGQVAPQGHYRVRLSRDIGHDPGRINR